MRYKKLTYRSLFFPLSRNIFKYEVDNPIDINA